MIILDINTLTRPMKGNIEIIREILFVLLLLLEEISYFADCRVAYNYKMCTN